VSIRLTDEAEADLSEALAYVADKSQAAANRLRDRVWALLSALEECRFDGPPDRLRSGELVQSWPLKPYRVYYQREGEALIVLRIYHQRRRPISRRRRPRAK
jgi:plasmid stabilization system protein ParE